MRPTERSPFLPGWRTAQDGLVRIRQKFATAKLPVKILMVVVFCLLAVPIGLVYAPFAVWAGRRTVAASLAVGVWGVVVALHTHISWGNRLALLVLPLVVVGVAHAG